jgi:hypothetical protein
LNIPQASSRKLRALWRLSGTETPSGGVDLKFAIHYVKERCVEDVSGRVWFQYFDRRARNLPRISGEIRIPVAKAVSVSVSRVIDPFVASILHGNG